MRFYLFFWILCCMSCHQNPADHSSALVLTGLDGTVYYTPDFGEEELKKMIKNLEDAKAQFNANPTEENCIWVGRRLGYLMKLEEAVSHFSDCLKSYPDSWKILRHRGHRYISLRQFKKAIEDLTLAASLSADNPIEIEPDGIPNKINTPLSSVQFNIWYHLGLAHFLSGDFDSAAVAYEECLKYCNNDDLYAATADWLYMTYRRLSQKEKADKLLDKVSPEMNIIENDAYHKRLLLYKGILTPDSPEISLSGENTDALQIATQGFGIGHWYLVNGDTATAKALFQKVKQRKSFTAFGFIAAEVELQRL